MSFTFLDIQEDFIKSVKKHSPVEIKTFVGKVTDYKPVGKKVYYVSPANSLGFMAGGIDKVYSTEMFPGIEQKVKQQIYDFKRRNKGGNFYLPVGSAFIVQTDVNNNYLIVTPTMLMPENVKNTRNSYFAMLAILHVLAGQNFFGSNDEVIIPGLCTGVGGMDFERTAKQIAEAFNFFKKNPNFSHNRGSYIIEPNLFEQPCFNNGNNFW